MGFISESAKLWRDPRAVAVRMVIKFGVAVYTIVTLITTWYTIHNSRLSMSTSPPSDYCIPFFDTVKNLAGTSVPTIAAYDYVLGLAVARICTNYTSSQLAAILDGKTSEYEPLASLGCDLRNSSIHQTVNMTCKIENGGNRTCSDVIDLHPTPFGYNWAYSPELIGPNCQILFLPLGLLPPCDGNLVASYAKYEPTALDVTLGTIFIPVGITVLQLIIYAAYWFTRKDHFLAYVGEGLLVPFAYGIERFVLGREWPDLDPSMHPLGVIMLILQALAEGLVCPIVATYGCSLPRYPKQLALLIIKCMLVSYFIVIYAGMPIFRYFTEGKHTAVAPETADCCVPDAANKAGNDEEGVLVMPRGDGVTDDKKTAVTDASEMKLENSGGIGDEEKCSDVPQSSGVMHVESVAS